MSHKRLLVIDDEPSMLEVAKRYFEHANFEVHVAKDGQSGLDMARQLQPDLIVLDVMLPQLDGWQVLERLRQEASTPVLMLTARGEEHDRLRGLESGADDYLVKPFSPRELVARAKIILRRGQNPNERIYFDGVEIDVENRRVQHNGQDLGLTKSELDLLLLLARHPGRLWAREDLLERLWGMDFAGVDRVVDVHLSNLRRKLGTSGRRIQTLRGQGYRFLEDAAGDASH